VLVEVKRSTNTQIRREVVGQMLDYAANGVRYWPVAVLRESLEATAAARGATGDDLIAELQPHLEPDEFWKAVEANLAAGRIRMLFVADALPDELVRIIEFLNEQMSPAEVLGIEVRQYVGAGHTVYVPHVVGQTMNAVTAKASARGQQWDRTTFLAAAAERCPNTEVALMRQLLDDVDRRGHKLSWGRGATPGVSGWYPIPVPGTPTAVWQLNANNDAPTTHAYLVFYFADLVQRLGSAVVERAAARLEAIPSLVAKIAEARSTGWRKYPSVYLKDVVSSPDRISALFDAIDALHERQL
jgi:hypothetical protein